MDPIALWRKTKIEEFQKNSFPTKNELSHKQEQELSYVKGKNSRT
jgi:hypothetical protein